MVKIETFFLQKFQIRLSLDCVWSILGLDLSNLQNDFGVGIQSCPMANTATLRGSPLRSLLSL